jgi:plastocyanin
MTMFALAATPPLAPVAAPARVLGFADEFHFNLSRASIPAGRVLLQLKNIGEDDHDLRIIGPNGVARAETGKVKPDKLGQIRITLPRGHYTYVCTVADHDERGMKGRLTVTARARGAG